MAIIQTPETANPATVGRLAETAGFDSIWIGEHPAIPVEYKTPYPLTAVFACEGAALAGEVPHGVLGNGFIDKSDVPGIEGLEEAVDEGGVRVFRHCWSGAGDADLRNGSGGGYCERPAAL